MWSERAWYSPRLSIGRCSRSRTLSASAAPGPGAGSSGSRRWASRAGSWLNAIETFFSALTRKRVRRGNFHSLVNVRAAINRYAIEHIANSKPFVWTAIAATILAKVAECSVSVRALAAETRDGEAAKRDAKDDQGCWLRNGEWAYHRADRWCHGCGPHRSVRKGQGGPTRLWKANCR